MEIIVCWSVVSKLTGTSINVYSQNENNGAYSLKSVSKAITGSDFICVDANDDGVKDLLVFATELQVKIRGRNFIRLKQGKGAYRRNQA